MFTLPASREFTSAQDFRRTMRSTRFYLALLALVAIVLCTSSKGATTTTQTLARHAATSGPRRLDLVQPVKGAQSRAQGLNNKAERFMSRRVARSGQRSPDQTSSLSLSPSSSSHATDSSKDGVPDLPTLVVTSDTQFAPRPAAALDLKPNPSHPGAETNVRISPQLAKRCHYIGTFFRRIDCNAPANSTSIPYSHAPAASSVPSSSTQHAD
ncbi:hypothetical protein RHOSPDRAFT_35227 [Rhodotorula sp. JG-1b]|nr:hypothetical protein RHOSPDRAFT_35227 [Rhodotorula sp. JG-1b]